MKFKITKHFKLDFLGDEWKETYLDFSPLTLNDVKTKLPMISKLNQEDSSQIEEGVNAVSELLIEKFVSGKAIGEEGKLIEVKKQDLIEFPLDVFVRAFSFLSQTEEMTSLTPSEAFLKQKTPSETPKV